MKHSNQIRVRFAPSPTGYLHIGSFRTALFNWLFARHNKGVFLVRIEDTDLERSKKEYVDSILESLQWVDIHADEPIIIQSERINEHNKVIQLLLDQKKVYKCFCSEEDLKNRHPREVFLKYDGYCRDRSYNGDHESYVVRFKIPDVQEFVFDDLIRGRVTFERGQLDDFIIARSDGRPIYNFVVVVDDAFSKITHVIRGEDHISNTPKQILLYQARNFTIPQFAHIPLILGPSGDRLSKRDGATSALEYKQKGYLPGALVNYLVRLGWAHGDQEVFSRDELIKFFTLENVGKKGSIFDIEKLNWLNALYIRGMSNSDLYGYMHNMLKMPLLTLLPAWEKSVIEKAIALFKERVVTMQQLFEEVSLLYHGPSDYNADDMSKWTLGQTKMFLDHICQILETSEWNKETLSTHIKDLAKKLGVKIVFLAQPIRLALLGKSDGPGVFELMEVLGKAGSIERIRSLQQKLA
jgi:glutamyl-tRNA synthetase